MGFFNFFKSGFSGSLNDTPGTPATGGSAKVALLRHAAEQREAHASITARADGGTSQRITSCQGASVAIKNGKFVVKLQPGGNVSGVLTKSGHVLEFEISS